MKCLLDTSVCINFLRRKPETVERLFSFKPRDVWIPVHAVTELEHGIYLGSQRKVERERVHALVQRFQVLMFNTSAAQRAGRLLYDLGRSGQTMKYFDMMIAAQAMDAGMTLASADADFEVLSGTRGLRLSKW